MAKKHWTLTDTQRDIYVEEISLGPGDVDGRATGYSVRKRTLRGGRQDGVDIVEVDNGRFSFVLLPTRGMGIWRAFAGELEIGWQSPAQGPVHPKFVSLADPSGLGWLEGFDELMCRCGLENNGGPEWDENGRLAQMLHGRIANLPAHRLDVTIDGETGEIAVTGVVDEAHLYGNKMRLTSTVSTRVGESGYRIADEVTNLSAEPGELELLYHTNFGQPFLAAGAKVVAPVRTVVPQTPRAAEGVATWDTYGDEEPGFTEQVYFLELAGDAQGNTQTLLRNAEGDAGVSLHFNTGELPHFTLWKSTQAAADGYVTGLEPGINLPNVKSFEKAQGRVRTLSGGERVRLNLRLEIHTDHESIAAAEDTISRLQGDVTPHVFSEPQPGWSAG